MRCEVHAAIVTVATDGTVTLATVSMGGFSVAASARRDPGDKNNPDIGADLAVARAFHAMARKFERQGNGAVRNADWIRSERQRRRALAAAGAQSGPPDEEKAAKKKKAGKK